MKSLAFKLLVPLLSVMMGAVYAATDSSIVQIQVKHFEFLKIVGTAAGINKTIAVDDIRSGNIVNIGSLGLESSIPGDCTLDFVSSNIKKFSLQHSQGKQILSYYQLDYKGYTITSDTTMILPCKTATTALDFKALGTVKKNPRAGLYSDTVTITVTSP